MHNWYEGKKPTIFKPTKPTSKIKDKTTTTTTTTTRHTQQQTIKQKEID